MSINIFYLELYSFVEKQDWNTGRMNDKYYLWQYLWQVSILPFCIVHFVMSYYKFLYSIWILEKEPWSERERDMLINFTL